MEKLLEHNTIGIALPTLQELSYYSHIPCDAEIRRLDPPVGKCICPVSFLAYSKYNMIVVGICVVYNAGERVEAGKSFRQIEIGVRIWHPANRGRGYGTEIADLLCQYAFNYLAMDIVTLKVLLKNFRAVRSYEKAGFENFDYEYIDGYLFKWMSRHKPQIQDNIRQDIN